MGDWDAIRAELNTAEREQRTLSDLGARIIASQFYDQQTSALYALASTGAIIDGWDTEIHTAQSHTTHDAEQQALTALAVYCEHRNDKGPQPHWPQLKW